MDHNNGRRFEPIHELNEDALPRRNMVCASEPSISCYFTQLPNLIENSGCQRSLVLRQEATVVLLHDIGRILDGVACLLIGSGLLQHMCRKNVPQVMRSMRQQALDRTAFGIGVVDPIALDDGPPRLVEGGRIIGGVDAGRLHGLHEERSGILGSTEEDTAMPVDVSIKVFVEIE